MSEYFVFFKQDAALAHCASAIPNVYSIEEALERVTNVYSDDEWEFLYKVNSIEEIGNDLELVKFGLHAHQLTINGLIANMVNGERLPTDMEKILFDNLWNLYEK